MDAGSRDLERRWKEGRDPADWARWLRERLRRGELDPAAARLVERIAEGAVAPRDVSVAAYLGDPLALAVEEHQAVALASYVRGFDAARVVAGDGAITSDELTAWLEGLVHFGPELLVRALIAAGEAALDAFRRDPPTPHPAAADYPWDWRGEVAQTAANALALARDWVRCPCSACARRAARVPSLFDPYSPYFVVLVAEQAVRAAAYSERWPTWPDALERCARAVATGIEEGARGALAPRELVRAIAWALVPELLYGAPPLED